MHQVLATERIGPLRRGDFVLCTTNLRSWIAADAMHQHHTIFIKTANSVCRGAGDSHLPRSMRARHPQGLFSPSAGGFRAMHDQLTQLDRGRCDAPAPYCFSSGAFAGFFLRPFLLIPHLKLRKKKLYSQKRQPYKECLRNRVNKIPVITILAFT